MADRVIAPDMMLGAIPQGSFDAGSWMSDADLVSIRFHSDFCKRCEGFNCSYCGDMLHSVQGKLAGRFGSRQAFVASKTPKASIKAVCRAQSTDEVKVCRECWFVESAAAFRPCHNLTWF